MESSKNKHKPVVIVVGPTASGKSALAIDVAEGFTGTVINGDSMQVYKELSVVTARPPAQDEMRVPHALFGVMSVSEPCSVGRWLDMVCESIEDAWAEGRLPIVVGGTGLYLKALIHGLSPIPAMEPSVRANAEARYDEIGAEAFHEEVRSLDPITAERIKTGDTQRLQRAWQVAKGTGKPLSAWNDEANVVPDALQGASFLTIALEPHRDALYAAINWRFEEMVSHGALDEVKDVLAMDLEPTLPAMKAVGVPELGAYIKGEIPLSEAIARAQQASRRYAKRQLTWLRNQIPEAKTLPAQYSESSREKIFSFIREFLLTDGK